MNEANKPARVLVVDDEERNRRLLVAMKGDHERLIKEGFDGYLGKPIRYNAFLASVAALLEGRKK